MFELSRAQLSALLRAGDLLHGEEAAAACGASEDALEVSAAGDVAPLETIYRRRAEHLSSYSSKHARDLCASVREFLQNISEFSPAQAASVSLETEGPHGFDVFLAGDGSRVLGCMRTVSKLAVDDATWQALWGRDRR